MPASRVARYSVTFELKCPKGHTKGSLRADITHAGECVRFPIDFVRIDVDKWDAKKHRVKGFTRLAHEANDRINEVERTVDMWFGQHTPGSLADLQQTITGKTPRGTTRDAANASTHTDGIEGLFLTYLADKKKVGKKAIERTTEQGFETVMKALIQFEIAGGVTLTAASFAVNTQQQLYRAKELEVFISEWLATEHVRQGRNPAGQGLSDNTRNRAMRRLATVLKWAEAKGLAGAHRLHTKFTYQKVGALG